MPGLGRRLSGQGLALMGITPECRWFGLPVSGSMGGAPLVCKAVLPLALTPSQLHLGTSWQPVALLDGTIRAGNTLYCSYCEISKRMKLKCSCVRLVKE